MSAIENTAVGTAAASFIAAQIGNSIAGTFGMGYAKLVIGQAAWVAAVGALGEKACNGTATGGDYANVIQKTSDLLLGLGLTMAQVNPWVRGAFTATSFGLFVYNNLDTISDFYDRAGYQGDLRPTHNIYDVHRITLANLIVDKIRDLFASAESQSSPLILDLDGDGVETLSKVAGVHFDHDENGFAELSGWVGKDDGLLVWDRNGNGQIDDGSELFGNNTRLANGFAALAELDSNGDGKVDASDAGLANLRIWQDADSDGLTEAGELRTLEAAGVLSLNTAYTTSSTVTNGNAYKQNGNYELSSGGTAAMSDVWFAADYVRTVDRNPIDIPEDIAALPDLAGFGNVCNLRQAMARAAVNDF